MFFNNFKKLNVQFQFFIKNCSFSLRIPTAKKKDIGRIWSKYLSIEVKKSDTKDDPII